MVLHRIIYWVLKIIATILAVIPFIIGIPSLIFFFLSEELEEYYEFKIALELEIKQLKKDSDEKQVIL